jgi:hypothetical protein
MSGFSQFNSNSKELNQKYISDFNELFSLFKEYSKYCFASFFFQVLIKYLAIFEEAL